MSVVKNIGQQHNVLILDTLSKSLNLRRLAFLCPFPAQAEIAPLKFNLFWLISFLFSFFIQHYSLYTVYNHLGFSYNAAVSLQYSAKITTNVKYSTTFTPQKKTSATHFPKYSTHSNKFHSLGTIAFNDACSRRENILLCKFKQRHFSWFARNVSRFSS